MGLAVSGDRDVMCVRRHRGARARGENRPRAIARDIQHLYADFADAATLKRLDARFKERGR
jgi:hypothetical protein